MSAALEPQVNEKPFFEQIKEYWKHSFYITSLATVGTHWAAAMSTNTEFKDQYMKSIETTHPFKSWAFGRNGLFTCNGDLDGKAPDLACLGASILSRLPNL